MRRLVTIGLLLLVIAAKDSVPQDPNLRFPLDSLYRQAQREFHRANYEGALPLLQSYVEKSKTSLYKRERLFWVIDQIGRILLRERSDPDAAISFFAPLSKDKRLNEAELDILDSWIAGAGEWKKLGGFPNEVTSADELFDRGKTYYQKGLAITQFRGDDNGNAYFHIAASYLVPFIVNFDDDARIKDALLMMGDIRRQSWTDASYWSHNFYLLEAIRRFPHSAMAMRAYAMLEEDIHLGYTGSSGDNTPPSLLRMLRQFKKLAEPK